MDRPTEIFARAVADHRAGRVDEAQTGYRRVLNLYSDHPGALSNLGRIARARGDLHTALSLYRRATVVPDAPAEAHFNLGNALRDSGDRDGAIAAYRRARALSPSLEAARAALVELGVDESFDIDTMTRRAEKLFRKGDHIAAEAILQSIASRQPEDSSAQQNLGFLYRSAGLYRKALGRYRVAATLSDAPIIRVEIANCLVNIGRAVEARHELEKLLATSPGRRAAASSYLMSLLYDPVLEPAFIGEEHRRLTAEWRIEARKREKPAVRRTMRVGYLTADLSGHHPVAQFLAPILEAHRDSGFVIESIVYDARPRADATAGRMADLACVRSLDGCDDDAAAELIRRDDLDLLIDLSGHTSGQRLTVLGLHPAPVQACFIGYPATTGFTAVDWLIGDSVLFPSGAEDLYAERLARLPHAFLAFAPPPGMPQASPDRNPGPVTFGSLNHLPKINAGVLDLWARIVDAVPGSRLLLQCAAFAEAETAIEVAEALAARGIDRERLTLEGPQPFPAAMQRYAEIDIALDPFPYNGGTTTCHALWMGVPVVTLEGRYFPGRIGASLLSAVGQTQWVARDANDYVRIAISIAREIDDGRAVRRELVESASTVPLFDTARFAGDLAELYRRLIAQAA